MAVVKTYLGAIKPIGEKILLQYTYVDSGGGRTTNVNGSVEFDFVINADYIITDVAMVKTFTSLPTPATAVALGATVYVVDPAGAATAQSQAAFKSIAGTPDGILGQKAQAGRPTAGVAVGAITTPFAFGSATSFEGEPVIQATNALITGTSNSQQRVRLSIAWSGVDAVGGASNPSCFVEIKFAKTNPLTRVSTLQDSELLYYIA